MLFYINILINLGLHSEAFGWSRFPCLSNNTDSYVGEHMTILSYVSARIAK